MNLFRFHEIVHTFRINTVKVFWSHCFVVQSSRAINYEGASMCREVFRNAQAIGKFVACLGKIREGRHST